MGFQINHPFMEIKSSLISGLRVLESELKAESRHIRTIIKARGLWHPNVQGKTFAIFRTDSRNLSHQLSTQMKFDISH